MLTRLPKLAAFMLVAACGGQVEDRDVERAPAPAIEHHPRFVGDWMMAFVTGRDSSVQFTLSPSGSIQVHHRGDGTPFDAIAELPGTALRCAVGASWRSIGSSSLVFVGECTDGSPRDIVIDFKTDPSLNATDELRVEVASVGGRTDWRATEFNGPWVLQRCCD